METTKTDPCPVLLTIKDFVKKHRWAREATLRNLVARERVNGFQSCVYRLGRKILLDESRVFEFLRKSGGNS